MSSPKLEEEGVLREWAPLSKLLQQIPMRCRQGVFYEDVKFTCVDATIECIVLGTNCGTVFWYDRSSHYVQPLRLEKGSNCVTSVKVVSTVDFMVAAGDNLGIVSIFKIPKNISGNQTFSSNLAEKIERYIVDGLHKSKVLALDWSINGQKLFSGDAKGVVVFTEMDFVMNLSKAREIVNEKYSIVQLSYNQRLQVLLISSELRCIIWRNQSTGATITQIGQRERSSLLPLGGTFICDPSGDVSIFSCRGGLKLWRADLDGNVKFTLLFKDALKKCKNTVKLLKTLESHDKPSKLYEFGKLFSWRDGLFVSYSKNHVFVVDPTQVSVVSSLLDIKEISCVCTTRTELFIVAGPRELIRLGYTPDLCDSSIGGFGNMAQAESVSSIPDVNLTPVIGSPLSTSYTWNTYLSANMANSEPSSSEVNYGREPTALPPVVSIQDGVPELRLEPSRYQQYTSIGQQGFDDIIYSQKRLPKHKSRRKSAEFSETKSKSQRISLNGVASYFNSIGKFLNGEFTPTICDGELEGDLEESLLDAVPKDVLPDMRNIDAIVEDVARKEVLLDAMLESFNQNDVCTEESNECISSSDVHSNNSSSVESHSSNQVESISRKIFEIELEKPELISSIKMKDMDSFQTPEPSTAINSSFQENEVPPSLDIEIHNNNNNIISAIEDASRCTVHDVNPIETKPLTETDLSESSMFEISLIPDNRSDLEDISHPSAKEDCAILDCKISESTSNIFPSVVSDTSFNNGWCSMSCPDIPVSLSSWNKGLVMCSPKLKVYTFSTLPDTDVWSLLDYKAEDVFSSPDGGKVLKIHCSVAHYSENWSSTPEWMKVGIEVRHAAISTEKIWFISNGELFFMDIKSGLVSNYLSQSSLSSVYLFDSGFLFISENGRIFLLENEDWRLIRGIINAKLLAVGPNHLIWAVDSQNTLFISDNIRIDKPIWWQVPVNSAKDNEILSISSTEDGIYIAFKNSPLLYFNKTYVTGHRWIPASLQCECTQITAGAVFEEKGCIWVLDKNNKLIALDGSLNVLKEVVPPCKVVCLASTPGALWLLADDGNVYLRQDITDHNPVGVHWKKLNLEQLRSQVEMVGISCGPDVVWACDIRGKVIMLVGSPHSIANDTVDPAWVSVDGKPIENNTFTKVYVGPDTYMVWALDNAGNIYVREAVFPTFPLGTGWVHVQDIKASHITISSDAVYALNRDGVYKRIGISQSNYIGDDWLYFPIKLDYISASFDLGLYGICSRTRNIVSHLERKFAMSEHITVEKDWALL